MAKSKLPKPTIPGSGWKLLPYIAETGKSEVIDFLDELRSSRFKMFVHFDHVVKPLLEEKGPFAVGPPHWEGVGGSLYEIRSGKVRIYCAVKHPKVVLMYRGVVKFWPLFRGSDRSICERYHVDAMSSRYNQQQRELEHLAYQQRRSNDPR